MIAVDACLLGDRCVVGVDTGRSVISKKKYLREGGSQLLLSVLKHGC